MFKSLVALAIAGAMSVPVVAQTAPQTNQAQPTKPLTVKKNVCTRVDNEETTGSRLGSAPMVCKLVEVPASKGGAADGKQVPSPSGTGGNSF